MNVCVQFENSHHNSSRSNRSKDEEATSPEGGVKERGERERGARGGGSGGGESRSTSPASRASPPPDERDIEHSIPATLIQDPNAESSMRASAWVAAVTDTTNDGTEEQHKLAKRPSANSTMRLPLPQIQIRSKCDRPTNSNSNDVEAYKQRNTSHTVHELDA
ncbi:jg20193 [Pararge aegeria aegeria]|uniref:Jg20193 protein n=1 Tax=Pararge aegeria aegeria TaxID=348720 RepID=A0A8S4S1J5_9NEOP|nr:jg20193 [Pararge aegeria aegeria]